MANPYPQLIPASQRGSGRPSGPRKSTEIVRAGLRNAVEILRNGSGENPIEAAQKIARFFEGISQKRIEALATDIGNMPLNEAAFIVDTLNKSVNVQLRLAAFVFPQPGRVDLLEAAEAMKEPKTITELANELKARGLPSWVFGADMPVVDIEADDDMPVESVQE